MILDANDEAEGNRETAEKAASIGLTIENVRRRISESLGIILSSLIEGSDERTFLITGGDTLLESMNRLGIFKMSPLKELFPGIVLSRISVGGRLRNVITKSGGFGEETLLEDLKKHIEKQQEE